MCSVIVIGNVKECDINVCVSSTLQVKGEPNKMNLYKILFYLVYNIQLYSNSMISCFVNLKRISGPKIRLSLVVKSC